MAHTDDLDEVEDRICDNLNLLRDLRASVDEDAREEIDDEIIRLSKRLTAVKSERYLRELAEGVR